MKRLALSICFAILGVLVLNAQNRSLPYVDIPTAQARVAALEEENATLQDTISQAESEISRLQDEIAEHQTQINRIEPILYGVQDKSTELFAVFSDISDAEMRTSARTTLDEFKDLEQGLEGRIRELERAITAAQREVEAQRKSRDRAAATEKKNQDEITLLNASIAKTQLQQESLAAIMADMENFLSESEEFMNN